VGSAGEIDKTRDWKFVEPCPLTVCADAGCAITISTTKAVTTLTPMARSRIIGAILALGAAALLSATPADAHPGATVFEIKVGVVVPIEVLVPADYGKPISEIDISTAPGFRFAGAIAPAGWQASQTEALVRFTGGVIPAYSPGLVFTLRGSAAGKGELIFPVATHSPDGSVMEYTGGPGSKDAGVVVYAGETPTLPGSKPFPLKAVAGGVVAGVGVVGTGVLVIRRRRRPT
jgi:hypothetical protein